MHVLPGADRARQARIEALADQLDARHAAFGQDAVEPPQRDAEAFAPILRLRAPLAPAAQPAWRRRRGRRLQRGVQPVTQLQQVQQQRAQQRLTAFPGIGLRALQLLLQRGVTGLQRAEHAAELVQRLLHQPRFGAHLVADRRKLDEHREQIGLRAAGIGNRSPGSVSMPSR